LHRLSHLRIRRWLGYLVLGLLLPLVFGIANAQTNSSTTSTETPSQEVIENYESKINVRKDGRLNVTETITFAIQKMVRLNGAFIATFPILILR